MVEYWVFITEAGLTCIQGFEGEQKQRINAASILRQALLIKIMRPEGEGSASLSFELNSFSFNPSH